MLLIMKLKKLSKLSHIKKITGLYLQIKVVQSSHIFGNQQLQKLEKKVLNFYFCFSSQFLTNTFFSIGVFDYECRRYLLFFFLSEPTITPHRKNEDYLKKNQCSFFQIISGTFPAFAL